MTQKVEVAFGLAFIQLINVVRFASTKFWAWSLGPRAWIPMYGTWCLVPGACAWYLLNLV